MDGWIVNPRDLLVSASPVLGFQTPRIVPSLSMWILERKLTLAKHFKKKNKKQIFYSIFLGINTSPPEGRELLMRLEREKKVSCLEGQKLERKKEQNNCGGD